MVGHNHTVHRNVYLHYINLFLMTITKKAALDHEGRAVRVAVLWGYFINFDDYNDTISATYNTVIVTNSIFREEPFRGIATASKRARLEKPFLLLDCSAIGTLQ